MNSTLKIKADSEPKSVAGAIAKQFEEGANSVELQAIGAGAVNQLVKSIIIARSFVATSGLDLYAIPAFVNINIDGEDRTGIKFIINKR